MNYLNVVKSFISHLENEYIEGFNRMRKEIKDLK